MDFYQIFLVRSFAKNQIKCYQTCYPKFVLTLKKLKSNPILSKIASHNFKLVLLFYCMLVKFGMLMKLCLNIITHKSCNRDKFVNNTKNINLWFCNFFRIILRTLEETTIICNILTIKSAGFDS